MDAFESIVAMLFERQGYWVKPSFKVNLTSDDKREIGLPSCPRWELDIIAYKARTNEILVIECKSYLDSTGVSAGAIINGADRYAKRYKLFNNTTLRGVILKRLKNQLLESHLCSEEPKVTFCLVAGKIKSQKDRAKLIEHFNKNGWLLYDEAWVKKELGVAADSKYHNDVSTIVAKLLLRN